MSQFDQLSDAEIDARFRISGPKPVAFLLAGYVKAREPFSVHFQHGEEMFLSTLLDAQADNRSGPHALAAPGRIPCTGRCRAQR